MTTQPPNPRLQKLNALADATVLAALFTLLAFQEIRFEGYEAEKAALLLLLFGILAGTLLCRISLHPAALRHIRWRQPMMLGSMILALITGLGVLTSLSSPVHWFGSADRSQGALMQLGYLLLFGQAILSAERLQKWLVPVLIVLAVPVCLFAWIVQLGFEVSRPGSTTGNPNFVASWLILAILVIGNELVSGQRGFLKLKNRVGRWFIGGILTLLLATLALTESRGAWLGLIAAGFIYGCVWAATRRKKWLLAIGTFIAVGGIGSYVALGQFLGSTRPIDEVPRFFRFFEDFRIESWTGAHYLLFEFRQPLVDAAGTPDAFSSVRPVLGYGLDHVAYMQGIVDTVYQRVTYLNSFHNFLLDTMVMQGGLGLLAWLLIYGGAGMMALQRLNLLPKRYVGFCALLFVAAVPFTICMVGNVLWYVNVRFLLFLGAGLGLVVGLWAWLVVVTWLGENPQSTDNNTPQTHAASLMLLLCLLVARWVEGQFGFVQIATEPLWWVLLGIFVAKLHADEPPAHPQTSIPTQITADANIWLVAALVAGLYVIHSLGNALTSRFVGYSLGGEYMVPLLLAILAVGAAGIYSTTPRLGQKWGLWLGMILVIWAFAYGIKEGIIAAAATSLDTSVIQPQVPPENLLPPFQLLALKGIVLAWGSWAAWVVVCWQPTDAPKRRRQMTAAFPMWMLGIVFIFGVIGSLYYVGDYAASTLHAAGKGFASVDSPKTYAVGLAAFAAAQQAQLNRGQLLLEAAELSMKQVRITNQPISPDTAAEPALVNLFATQPYYHYTRLWATFCENYPIARCGNLQAYLPSENRAED